jgi:hypothetical protein
MLASARAQPTVAYIESSNVKNRPSDKPSCKALYMVHGHKDLAIGFEKVPKNQWCHLEEIR